MLRALIGLTGRTHLNLSLPAAPGYTARVVERPGLWMPQTDLAPLLEEMRALAARATPGGALDYGVLSGAAQPLCHSILTLVRRADGRLVAFNALAVMEVPLGSRPVQVLHLGLVLVDPDERARGLSWVLYGLTCFLLLVRGGLRPIWVSNVTQVPAIVGMVAESFGQVYPAPALSGRAPHRRSLTHLLLARQIMARHRQVFGVGPEAGFDEDRFVISNAYTGGSDGLKKRLADCTPHRDPACTAFCAERLDYDRGDDLLQLGLADLPSGFAYLARSVPRRSLARLGLAIAGVALTRLALPLVAWLDAGRDHGLLRARPSRGRA
jgi:hypothetical protein